MPDSMDASQSIPISLATFERLRLIAEEDKISIESVLEIAVNDLDRKRFWERFTRSCEAIRADPEASAAIDAEDAIWECTLLDGLDEEDRGIA